MFFFPHSSTLFDAVVTKKPPVVAKARDVQIVALSLPITGISFPLLNLNLWSQKPIPSCN